MDNILKLYRIIFEDYLPVMYLLTLIIKKLLFITTILLWFLLSIMGVYQPGTSIWRAELGYPYEGGISKNEVHDVGIDTYL